MDVPPEITATFNNLLNIATGLGLVVCSLFMVFAGFSYMTSGGNPAAVERSKSAAFNAAIGFAIILSARILAQMVQNAVVH
jgi:formate hydrogenlyase subunit 4